MAIGSNAPFGVQNTGQSMPTPMNPSATRASLQANSQGFSANKIPGAHHNVERGRKRKSGNSKELPPNAVVIDLTEDAPKNVNKKAKTLRKNAPNSEVPERRARVFRKQPPRSFLVRLERIRVQRYVHMLKPGLIGRTSANENIVHRMIVVGHTVGGTEEAPEISFDIVGTTGNIYKTVIGKEPTCDCPDGLMRNQCKHICYGTFPKCPSLELLYLGNCPRIDHDQLHILNELFFTDGVSSSRPCPQSPQSSPVPACFLSLGKGLSC